MRRDLLLLLCAGCNRALGLDPTIEVDALVPDAAYVPPGCSGSRFVSTTDVSVMTNGEIDDPTMLDDHEIWFTSHMAGGGYQIASARRTSSDQPFGAPVIGSFKHSANDSDPALTHDGLHLLFVSDDAHVYQTDRAAPDAAWSPASLVPGIDGESAGLGFDITPDGLAIYIASTDGVHTARRASPIGTFGPVTVLAPPLMMQFPSISPDELELFFNSAGSNELDRITRTDRGLPFDVTTRELVYQSAADADITADSRTLIYMHGGQLQTAHRECP
jgi:hypothetical protein